MKRMFDPQAATGAGWRPRWRGTAALLATVVVALTLSACGNAEEANPGVPEPTEATTSNQEFREGASPEAITEPDTTDRPPQVNELTATIEDGQLEPDPLEGTVDQSYVLTITGDGTAHTLVITDLVTETEIAAEGETEIDFTVSGATGDRDIILDGQSAGTFRVVNASGMSD